MLKADVITAGVDGHQGLLVIQNGFGLHRVHKQALAKLAHFDDPADGRAVHMDIEDVEEDAEAQPASTDCFNPLASVTTPSPGETICPAPWGIVRLGSRKNHRKNAASTIGNAMSQTGMFMYQSAAATAPSPKA